MFRKLLIVPSHEVMLNRKKKAASVTIIKAWRKSRLRCKIRKMIQAFIYFMENIFAQKIQRLVRGNLVHTRYKKLRATCVWVQKKWKMKIFSRYNFHAQVIGKHVRGYLARKRVKEIHACIFIQRKWRKKRFRRRFYILQRDCAKNRRRRTRFKPWKMRVKFFHAWRNITIVRKQEMIRKPVKNIVNRRFRSTFFMSIQLQTLDLRAIRFLFKFMLEARPFYKLSEMSEFLKFVQIIISTFSKWNVYSRIIEPLMHKIANTRIISRLSTCSDDDDIRHKRLMVILSTLVRALIRFHARFTSMFEYITNIHAQDVNVYMDTFLAHVYKPKHLIDEETKTYWYDQTNPYIPMFTIDLDYDKNCKCIVKEWLISHGQFTNDICNILDNARFDE